MGDVRFQPSFERIRDSPARLAEIRRSSDEEIIAALAGASSAPDPVLANVLATEALNRSERSRRAIDSVTDGVIAVDRDGAITLLNPAAERILGWLRDEVAGRPLGELLPSLSEGRGRAPDVADLLGPLRTGAVLPATDVELRRRDGSAVATSITSAPTIVHGEVMGAVLVLREQGGSVRARGASASQPPQKQGTLRRALAGDSRSRILVVEDEEVVAMGLTQTLTNAGHEVVRTTSSGEEAVTIAQNEHLDLILMDIHLRGALDGIAAAEAIRKMDVVPIIYLTAYADDDTLRRAKVPEPSGYLVKPYEDSELLAAVEMAIHRGGRERERREAHDAVSARERLLQQVVDHIPALVSIKDREGQYLLVNRRFEDTFHVSRAEVRGKTDHQLFPPAVAQTLGMRDEEAFETEGPVEFEASVAREDGPHHYDVHKFCISHAPGGTEGVCSVLTEATGGRS